MTARGWRGGGGAALNQALNRLLSSRDNFNGRTVELLLLTRYQIKALQALHDTPLHCALFCCRACFGMKCHICVCVRQSDFMVQSA